MTNIQVLVENNARIAMHIAIELCEQASFDSVKEAFDWLMEEYEEPKEDAS